MTTLLRGLLFLAVPCLLPALLLEGVWLRGEVPYPRGVLESAHLPWSRMVPAGSVAAANPLISDPVYQFLPWDRVARRQWTGLEPPLWNPYGGLGASLVGNPQAALLDPIRLAATAVGFRRAPALRAWLRLALAGLLCFGFLRYLGLGRVASLFGAAAFQLGGFLIPWLSHPHAGAALYLPGLLWAGDRLLRRGGGGPLAATALLCAAQLLAGHPQTVLHLLVVAGTFWLVRFKGTRPRGWLRLIAGLGTGAFLAAPMLIPFADCLRGSLTLADREGGPGEASLPLTAAATFAIPRLFGWPLDGTWRGPLNACESVAYIGLAPWLLAPFAVADPRVRRPALTFLAVAGVSAAVAYGLPGLRELLEALPLFGWVANRRLLLGVSFAGAILGALGLDALLRRPDERSRAGWWGGLAVAAAAAVGTGAAAAVSAGGPWSAFRGAPAGWAFFAIAVVAILTLLRLVVTRRVGPRWCWLLVPILLFDLALHWRCFQPTAPPAEVLPTTPAIEALRDRARPGDRVLGLSVAGREPVLFPNTQQAFGLADLRNYDSLGWPAFRSRLLAAVGVPTPARLASPDLNVFGPRFLAVPVPLERLASAARLLPGRAHVVVFEEAPRAAAVVLLSYLVAAERCEQDAVVGELRVRSEVDGGGVADRVFPLRAGRETADGAAAQLGAAVAHRPIERAWTFTVRDAAGDPFPRHVYRARIAWDPAWGRPLGAEIRFAGKHGWLEVEGLGLETAEGACSLDPRRRPFFRGAILLYENEHAWPRAFLAPDGALEGRQRDRVRPAEVVAVTADRMVVRGEARPGEVLVVTDAAGSGWQARVSASGGEKPVPVRPAAGFFRAVAVEPGAFTVTFLYRPLACRIGLVCAAVAVCFLGAFVAVGPIRRRVQARRDKRR